jgi:hypothetical protein
MLNVGNGLMGFGAHDLSAGLLDITAMAGAEAACLALQRLSEAEELQLRSTCIVWGLALEERTVLAPGVDAWLMDMQEQLQRSSEWHTLDVFAQAGQRLSILSSPFVMRPAFLAPEEGIELDYKGSRAQDDLRRLTMALSLIGPTPMSFEYIQTEHVDPHVNVFFAYRSRLVATYETRLYRPFDPIRVDDGVRDFCEAYRGLSADAAARLDPLIAAFNSAIRRREAAQKALGAMSVLEATLRAPDDSPYGVQKRICDRAAALLSGVRERREIESALAAAYSLRNQAAHHRFERGDADEAAAEDGLRLVAEVLRSQVMIEAGDGR